MLKAIGARSRTLLGGVVAQAAIVAVIAAVVGTGFAVLLDVVVPPDAIPYQLLPSRVAISGVALVLAAIVGSAFSLRRVLHVDPASAIGRTS
jgi:putative ABC transport system permease protein